MHFKFYKSNLSLSIVVQSNYKLAKLYFTNLSKEASIVQVNFTEMKTPVESPNRLEVVQLAKRLRTNCCVIFVKSYFPFNCRTNTVFYGP